MRLDLEQAEQRLRRATWGLESFSFVRIGDGEAMMLDPMSGSERYPNLGAYSAGTAHRITSAVQRADLVGVQHRRDGEFARVADLAGHVGGDECDADIWYRLEPEQVFEILTPEVQYDGPPEDAPDESPGWIYVGRHRYPNEIRRALGIAAFVTTPDAGAAHYAGAVMKMVRRLADEYKRWGVLIAAGPLGTILPPVIAEELEVPAFDIGGLADVWAGETTRTIIRDLGLVDKWARFLGVSTEQAEQEGTDRD